MPLFCVLQMQQDAGIIARALTKGQHMNPHALHKLFPGSSHAQIADRIGVATSTVSAWFHRGKVPDGVMYRLRVQFPRQWRSAKLGA